MLTSDLDFEDQEIALQVLGELGLYLTRRQMHVLFLCCQGYTQTQVAEELGVNQSTVQRHFARVLEKVKQIAVRYA